MLILLIDLFICKSTIKQIKIVAMQTITFKGGFALLYIRTFAIFYQYDKLRKNTKSYSTLMYQQWYKLLIVPFLFAVKQLK